MKRKTKGMLVSYDVLEGNWMPFFSLKPRSIMLRQVDTTPGTATVTLKKGTWSVPCQFINVDLGTTSTLVTYLGILSLQPELAISSSKDSPRTWRSVKTSPESPVWGH